MCAREDIECVVIGANGLVGRHLGNLLTAKGIGWLGTYNKRPEDGLLQLDITNPRKIRDFFSRISSPRVIFHCANLAGGVDFCEFNPEMAARFHLNATKYIGNHCEDIGATFIFISTDYVFDGSKDSYDEDEQPNPLNLYGRLKLKAEEWMRENLSRYIIVRTANIYGWDPKTVTPNYIMNLYNCLKDKRRFNAPSFLWGTPTYVYDLAEAMLELYLKRADGIFHVVGSSFVERFQWAKDACAILGLDSSLLCEVSEPKPDMVPRPLRSRLDTEKFTKTYATVLHDVADGLKLMRRDMNS